MLKRGAPAAVRSLNQPTHPKIKLLGFRVVYPPPPLSRGSDDCEAKNLFVLKWPTDLWTARHVLEVPAHHNDGNLSRGY